ncbi:hypothetical protein ACFQYP_38280 [Nonomuraea antimicrobica]
MLNDGEDAPPVSILDDDPAAWYGARDDRDSADAFRLDLLVAWAKRIRLVRTSKGRLYQVAKAAPLLRDPEALWYRAFEVLPELGPELARSAPGQRPASLVASAFSDLLPDLLNSMYGMDDMPVVRLAETVWLACQEFTEHFALGEEESPLRILWHRQVTIDLERTFELLSDLGAVELTRGRADALYLSDLDDEDQELPPDSIERLRTRLAEPDVLLARLTPPALRAVRERLLAEGRDAPLIGELSTASAGELLGVLAQHYPPEETATELNAWLCRPGQDVEDLLQAVRDCPFRTRTAAMLTVLAEALPQGRALVRDLRHDPVLGPAAVSLLMDDGEIDPGALGEREQLLLGAENFLTLLELGGPESLIDQLRTMAGGDAYELVQAILAAGHHDTVGLAEMRTLVAEPLRGPRSHLRLVSSKPPGARGRPKGTGKRRKR